MEKIISEQRRKDLEEAKCFFKNVLAEPLTGRKFEEYSQIYSFTNEDLAIFFNQIDFENKKKALSVLSSGDHVFNLVYKGIEKIDTFDSNRLTEYYALGFKKTAIQCLNYEEFMDLFTRHAITIEKRFEMIDYVISNMDFPYHDFFEEYFKYLKTFGNLRYLYRHFRSDTKEAYKNKYNLYLKTSDDFKMLQERLNHAQITFKCCDILDLTKFEDSYDIIELSNIMYSIKVLAKKDKGPELADLVKQLYFNNLRENGEILLEYCWAIFSPSYLFVDSIDYSRKRMYIDRDRAIHYLKKE